MNVSSLAIQGYVPPEPGKRSAEGSGRQRGQVLNLSFTAERKEPDRIKT
jgi:hypothetical protein